MRTVAILYAYNWPGFGLTFVNMHLWGMVGDTSNGHAGNYPPPRFQLQLNGDLKGLEFEIDGNLRVKWSRCVHC